MMHRRKEDHALPELEASDEEKELIEKSNMSSAEREALLPLMSLFCPSRKEPIQPEEEKDSAPSPNERSPSPKERSPSPEEPRVKRAFTKVGAQTAEASKKRKFTPRRTEADEPSSPKRICGAMRHVHTCQQIQNHEKMRRRMVLQNTPSDGSSRCQQLMANIESSDLITNDMLAYYRLLMEEEYMTLLQQAYYMRAYHASLRVGVHPSQLQYAR